MAVIAVHSISTHLSNDPNFRFPSREDFLSSMELSALSVKSIGDEIVLFTDNVGFELTKNLHHLYKEVCTDLEIFKNTPHTYWSLGKMYACSLMEGGFYHLDNDVYIFKDFDKNFDFLFQNKEDFLKYPFYKRIIDSYKNCVWSKNHLKGNYAYNCGVFGMSERVLNAYKAHYKLLTAQLKCLTDNGCSPSDGSLLMEQIQIKGIIRKNHKVRFILDELSWGTEYKHLIADLKLKENHLSLMRKTLDFYKERD